VQRAFLGVETRESQGGPGAYVAKVTPGAPASSAGLQPGDTIVAVGGDAVTLPEDIAGAISNRRPGDRIDIEVQRAGARRTLSVTLGARPPETSGTSSGAPTFP